MAVSISLLLYAVIRWDDAHAQEERERRQLADVVGRSMDAIVVADCQGCILYANSAARGIYGAAGEDLAGRSLTIAGFEPVELCGLIQNVLQGTPWKGELNHAAPDGVQRASFVNLFRLESFQGHAPVVAVIAHDLTTRKALQAQLLHSQKLAAVGELAAGLAHEINNPMAAIQSQVGLARDVLHLETAAQEGHEQLLSCIEETGRQVQRCGHIVDSLLRFSRRQKQDVSTVDLHDAIDQALTFVRTLPKLRGLELVHERHGPGAAQANLESVIQILVNLLINAADACGQGGRVVLRTQQAGDKHLAIEVQDNGSGVQPDVLERVFEPFFTTKPPSQGTGLGLSISYGLAQSLGGSLSLGSPPEGGTVATLTLPAGKSAECGLQRAEC
jgi:two-component system NtrC family sensor kinase